MIDPDPQPKILVLLQAGGRLSLTTGADAAQLRAEKLRLFAIMLRRQRGSQGHP